MKITNETILTQKGTMFTDGEDGYFMQQYDLYRDEEKIGISMVIEGNRGRENLERTFNFENQEFKSVKEVFEAAGYIWDRD